jgi:hypothetical protein
MAISTNKRLKAVQRGRDNSRVITNKRQPRKDHDSKKKERTKSRKKEVVSTKKGHYQYENDDVTGDETAYD